MPLRYAFGSSCWHENSVGSPSTVTLDPLVTGITGSFDGNTVNFPRFDDLEVWYRYGEGRTLPTAALETPRRIVTAGTGTTAIPGFDVAGTCTDFSYQVNR